MKKYEFLNVLLPDPPTLPKFSNYKGDTWNKLYAPGDRLYGPWLSIRENRIIIQPGPVDPFCRKPRLRENLCHDRKLAYSGYLGKSAQTRISKICHLWFSSIFAHNDESQNTGKVREYLPVMITLTLSSPQRHDDKFIKRHLLQEFLKALARQRGIKHYFWKAEAQLNGNIHFHIVIDRWIDKFYLQGLWNYYQKKHGYLDQYFAEHHHYNAPSTKPTGFKGYSSPVAYLMKYIRKDFVAKQNCKKTLKGCEGMCKQLLQIRRPIQGAVYRFSDSLLNLKPEPVMAFSDILSHLDLQVEQGTLRFVQFDYCAIYYCKKKKAYNCLNKNYKAQLKSHYKLIYDYLYNDIPLPNLQYKPPAPIKKPPKPIQLKLSFNAYQMN